jgi:hypothetical protein
MWMLNTVNTIPIGPIQLISRLTFLLIFHPYFSLDLANEPLWNCRGVSAPFVLNCNSLNYLSREKVFWKIIVKKIGTNTFFDIMWAISSFCRGVNEIFTLQGCYAAWIDSYRCFGKTYLSRLQVSLKMEPMACPKTPVNNYKSTLRNIPEDWISFTIFVRKTPIFQSVSTTNQKYSKFHSLPCHNDTEGK